MDTASANLF